jgi:hypothetical protein
LYRCTKGVVVLSLIRDFMILRQKKQKAKMLKRLNTFKGAEGGGGPLPLGGSNRTAPFTPGKPVEGEEEEEEEEDEQPGMDGYGHGGAVQVYFSLPIA